MILYKIKNIRILHKIKCCYFCVRFPFLALRYFDGKPRSIIPKGCWWYSIPEGWRKAFGVQMCREIKKALKFNNFKYSDFIITDVKEKHGVLEIYYYGCPEEVDDIIRKYEYISGRTCIKCGRRAKYITQGWISPYCENCLNEYEKNNSKEYYKDIDWYGWTKF